MRSPASTSSAPWAWRWPRTARTRMIPSTDTGRRSRRTRAPTLTRPRPATMSSPLTSRPPRASRPTRSPPISSRSFSPTTERCSGSSPCGTIAALCTARRGRSSCTTTSRTILWRSSRCRSPTAAAIPSPCSSGASRSPTSPWKLTLSAPRRARPRTLTRTSSSVSTSRFTTATFTCTTRTTSPRLGTSRTRGCPRRTFRRSTSRRSRFRFRKTPCPLTTDSAGSKTRFRTASRSFPSPSLRTFTSRWTTPGPSCGTRRRLRPGSSTSSRILTRSATSS
mmetsp:Transcript_9329/g.36281  ORF Transcript_9329/g.36281 Transcript_9329/m.36281 type:complete len:279 (-) Transcript_9329:540-1376(-)